MAREFMRRFDARLGHDRTICPAVSRFSSAQNVKLFMRGPLTNPERYWARAEYRHASTGAKLYPGAIPDRGRGRPGGVSGALREHEIVSTQDSMIG